MIQKNKRRTHIAMLGSFPPLRGISSYCMELAVALASVQPVHFISFKKMYPKFLYPGGDLADDNSFPCLEDSELNVQRKLTWYNPLTWIGAGLFTKTDVLHAQWWSLPLFPIYVVICGLFMLRKKPVVLTVHNVLPHETSPLFRFLSGILFRLADQFIVHTKKNRAQLITHYGIAQERITVIAHGGLSLFAPSNTGNNTDYRKELGFDDDHMIILLFGAIRHYKGIDTLLEAFSLVRKKKPESRLLIAGKLWMDWSPYLEQIKTLGLSDSVFPKFGYIPTSEVHRYFEIADLVTLPYHHFDSQSGAGAAAVSFHKPLIVSDVGGLPDLVCDRRYVVSPNCPKALGEAILHALTTPGELEKMAANAKTVERELSWTKIAQKTITVYKRVLKCKTITGGPR